MHSQICSSHDSKVTKRFNFKAAGVMSLRGGVTIELGESATMLVGCKTILLKKAYKLDFICMEMKQIKNKQYFQQQQKKKK